MLEERQRFPHQHDDDGERGEYGDQGGRHQEGLHDAVADLAVGEARQAARWQVS